MQTNPIKWDWETNFINEVTIVPNFLRDASELNKWNKQFPYVVFYEGKEMFACHTWENALESAEFYINRKGEKIGLQKIDLIKRYIKNEPKITFSEVHEILKKLGVSL